MKINLDAWKAEKSSEHGLEIEAGDETFRIPDPRVWPREAQEIIAAQKGGKADDEDMLSSNERLVTILLGGPDVFDRFRAAGGEASMIGLMLAEAQGANAGESPAS